MRKTQSGGWPVIGRRRIMASNEVFAAVAGLASAQAAGAGVGACELAGLIVSVLVANPDLQDAFVADPAACFWANSERFNYDNGALSWHGQNGQVVTPAELRAYLGRRDQ